MTMCINEWIGLACGAAVSLGSLTCTCWKTNGPPKPIHPDKHHPELSFRFGLQHIELQTSGSSSDGTLCAPSGECGSDDEHEEMKEIIEKKAYE